MRTTSHPTTMQAEMERMRRELEAAGELKPREASTRPLCEAELQRLEQRMLQFAHISPPAITIEQRPVEEEGGFDENGGVLWGAGEALASWLCEHCTELGELSRSTAVELGCGTGLVSTVLARLGVARVVATDRSEMACALAARNGELNAAVAPQFCAQKYEWGTGVDAILHRLNSRTPREAS